MWQRSAALLGCLAWHASHAAALRDVHVVEPRAFGHFIGDVLIRDLSFDVASPWQLAPSGGLPALGRHDPWVELVAARGTTSEVPGGRHHHWILTYQIVNSPSQIQLLTVPGIDVQVANGGEMVVERLPDWLLSVGPLAGDAVRLGLDAELPARPPRTVATYRTGLSSILLTAAACLFGAWFWAERRGLLTSRRGSQPFGNVRRELRSMLRQPRDTGRDRDALRALHRAFDRTAGHRLFVEQLEDFLTRHAAFADLDAEIRAFYALSRREFFGGDAAGELDLPALVQLSERLASRERRRARSRTRDHAAAV